MYCDSNVLRVTTVRPYLPFRGRLCHAAPPCGICPVVPPLASTHTEASNHRYTYTLISIQVEHESYVGGNRSLGGSARRQNQSPV